MTQNMSERELCAENLEDEPPLQREATWGVSYRKWRQDGEPEPIGPKASPINLPFKLCRALQMLRTKKRKKKLCNCPPKECINPKIGLLDRSALPQHQYMALLAIPRVIPPNPELRKPRRVKRCCKCRLTPLCRPRLIQMAIPNKRYVWENWKAYQHFLPAEMLQRFDQILKSGDNLEPKIARCYFKELQAKKRREIRRRKRMKRRKLLEKQRGDKEWLKYQINETVNAIADYIDHEPLYMLNFQQMMTSNELLKYLAEQRVVKIKSRTTRCAYKRTVIEYSDKLVKWMDTMSFFADIQPLDSREKMATLLEMPSLESLLEEEVEEIWEDEEEEEYRLAMMEAEEAALEAEGAEGLGIEGEEEGEEAAAAWEAQWAPADLEGEDAIPAGAELAPAPTDEDAIKEGEEAMEDFMATKILDKGGIFDELDIEGEGGSFMDLIRSLDEDILEKLIKILSESPSDFLQLEIDPKSLPGVTYGEVLEKLKQLRDGKLDLKQRRLELEERMIDWAKNNEPDQVDDRILDKIHETSTILAELFKTGEDSSRLVQDEEPGAPGTPGAPAGAGFEGGEEYGEYGEDVGGPIIEEIFTKQIADRDLEAAGAPGTEEDQMGGAPLGDTLAATAGEEGLYTGEEFEGIEEGYEDARGAFAEEYGAEEDAGFRQPGEERPPTVAFAEAGEEYEEDYPGMRGPGEAEGEYGYPEGGEYPEGYPEGGEYGEGYPEGEYGEGYPEYGEGYPEGGEYAEGYPEGAEEGEGYPEEGEGYPEGYIEGEEYGEGYPEGAEGYIEGEEFGFLPPEGLAGEEEALGRFEGELQRLDDLLGVIRGHKPSSVFEHEPGTVCCLSLKIWAVWLLEIANNAHNWTQWIGGIINQVRHYAAIIRGEVLGPNGEKKVLRKSEWREFVKETEQKVIAWRQYSQHVKELSNEIMDSFHGKKVKCCPKCLQDHLIKNVVTAHETLRALTEAINCAGYWQRCLDRIVEQTGKLTEIGLEEEKALDPDLSEGSSYSMIEIEEILSDSGSGESVYEIVEVGPYGPQVYDIMELESPSTTKATKKKGKGKKGKGKKSKGK